MPPELDFVIEIGSDTIAAKYYSLATGTILFYDCILTLADEIEYVWHRKKSWNRYFPMVFQIWQLAVSYNPQSQYNLDLCYKAAWFVSFTYAACTFLAQVALAARIYAVTMKKSTVAILFVTLVTFNLVLGLWSTSLVAKEGDDRDPPIPLDPYHLCAPMRHRTLELAYISGALVYDFLAFCVIMFFAVRSIRMNAGLRIQTILKPVAEDATWYFLFIFTSHFVLEMTLIFGRESIQLVPALGNLAYIPAMTSRIMLSLRKAATLPQNFGVSVWEATGGGSDILGAMMIQPQRSPDEEGDDILLDTYPKSEVATL